MRYKKLTGIILKKQNYREADQILTIWTSEAGKIRCMARGVRLPKSKLVYHLQDLTLVAFEVSGRGSLPTLISTRTVKGFQNLKTDLLKLSSSLYAAEMVLKMTADEHPNTLAFDSIVEFLDQLNNPQLTDTFGLLDEFALRLSRDLGFGNPKKAETHADVRNFIESLIERNLKSESFLYA